MLTKSKDNLKIWKTNPPACIESPLGIEKFLSLALIFILFYELMGYGRGLANIYFINVLINRITNIYIPYVYDNKFLNY